MRITVFGANGKVGRLVVAQALGRGHHVTAFVHSQYSFSQHDKLQVVQGDIYVTDNVKHALNGSQAVISALGSWGTPNKDVLSAGMRQIIPAMQTNNIDKIVSLTGAGAFAPDDKPNTLNKTLHRLMDLAAHKVLFDSEEHIRLLQKSQLNWTVIRSPIMNTIGNFHEYKLTSKSPFALATINRHAVAQAMVDLVESKKYTRQSPFIIR